MVKPYKAAFLIPSSAHRTLENIGWIFETDERLPSEIVDTLIPKLALTLKEQYDDTTVYVGPGLQVTVFRDEQGLVEQIYFQLKHKSIDDLKRSLMNVVDPNIELFIP